MHPECPASLIGMYGPTLADRSDAALQLNESGHSFTAQHFRRSSDGKADFVAFRGAATSGYGVSGLILTKDQGGQLAAPD